MATTNLFPSTSSNDESNERDCHEQRLATGKGAPCRVLGCARELYCSRVYVSVSTPPDRVVCVLSPEVSQCAGACVVRPSSPEVPWLACVQLRHYAGLLDASCPATHQLDLEYTEPPQYVVATAGIGGSTRLTVSIHYLI